MKCGDMGFKTVSGAPCGQPLHHGATACLWHSRAPEERSILAGRFGGMNRKSRAVAQDYKVRQFTDRAEVIRFAHDMAELALKRRAATLALQAFAQEMNEKLVNALLQVENGGVAFALYKNLTSVTTPSHRRPLPPRVITSPIPEDESG